MEVPMTDTTLNQITGAVISTVGAVSAVFITDWIRNWRKARNDIPAHLQTDHDYAINRAKTIQSALTPAANGTYTVTKAMRFDVASYQRLASEAFSQLTPRQRKALADITFSMAEADEANADAIRLSNLIGTLDANIVQMQAATRREQFLLGRVAELIKAYLKPPPTGKSG
jgi:hypothetical protein